MNDGKAASIQGTENGYTVWYDGKKVAEGLSLEEAGELLDELCYREENHD